MGNGFENKTVLSVFSASGKISIVSFYVFSSFINDAAEENPINKGNFSKFIH
jgi:hypothetical protein